MRIPEHIGIIPDGNRRWAETNGLSKENGYQYGLKPGLELYHLCRNKGVKEITFYGFTTDNTKRPSMQTKAFRKANVNAVNMLTEEDASILVVGNSETSMFPDELQQYTERTDFGQGNIKVNFLVNYGWKWDLQELTEKTNISRNNIRNNIKSSEISRIDLIIRWGNRRRLSGFLPVQSVYADFYVVDAYWPDFKPEHFENALQWYDKQDLTYGG